MGTSLRLALGAPAVIAAATLIAISHSDSRATSATSYAISNAAGQVPARYIPTDLADRDVTNHCITGGGSKENCVCLTAVMKYELSLRDYRAIAARAKPEELSRAIPVSLDAEGDKNAPLDPVIKTVLRAPDLSARCRTATDFFEQQSPT